MPAGFKGDQMRVTKALLVLTVLFVQWSCQKGNTSQGTSGNVQSPTGQQANTQVPGPSIVAGQNGPQVPASDSGSAAKPRTDACALLSSSEIESVQKEAVKETKLTGSAAGGFVVSQCFYTLPTFTNSISLQVTQRGEGATARDPREFWRDTFHSERDGEKDREKAGKKEEEEEGSPPPRKVTGVGDEAFWTGSRVGGALYVLKGNNYLRISVGGAGDQTEKIRKSKDFALKAISRL
jgi:hypothetical protein